MKVHLIKEKSIRNFVLDNARSKNSFEDWLSKLKRADWKNPSDIIATYGTADVFGNNSDRVVFNIGGNNYRLIAQYVFGKTEVHLFICWIGTHAEYDKICSANRQYTINIL